MHRLARYAPRLIVVLMLVLALALSGCGSKSRPSPDTGDQAGNPVTEVQTQPQTQAPPEGFEPLQSGQVYSPYTGLPMSADRVGNRPLAVMFDNLHKARPQKGLVDADIVYEAYVEGQITRYMAIFHSKLPSEIGPVRSARPYYVRLALENDGYYSHIGGSNDAFADIKKLKVADLDGMNVPAKTYWRKDHKPRPNNMYTSGEALMAVVSDRGYRTETQATFWQLGVTEDLAAAEADSGFKIVYRKPTSKDSVGYFIEFVYNEKASLYERLVNGEAHKDEGTGAQINAKSVIIQRAKTRVIDNAGHMGIQLVGKGDGYYMCAGKRLPITWEKTAEAERTQFYDAQGRPLVIAPGQLWIQLVPSDYQLMD